MTNRPKKIPQETSIHGHLRQDSYAWLRNKNDPDTLAYLEAENAYAREVLAPIEPLADEIFTEMKSHIKEDDISAPVRIDNYLYYTRTEAGKQYSIHCRKHGSMEAPEEILLDQNALAHEHAYVDVGICEVSPDHKLLAYSLDTSGYESFVIQIKNLETGNVYPYEIANTDYGFEWAADSKTFFYTATDSAHRPYRVYRHELGSDPKDDELVFEEVDERFSVALSKSRTEEYIFIESGSRTTSEARFISARDPKSPATVIAIREEGIEYYVEHRFDEFYIRTNWNAPDFCVMKTSVNFPEKSSWEIVVPKASGVSIENIELFARHMVILMRVADREEIEVRNLIDGNAHRISFEDQVYAIRQDSNVDFDTNLFRFGYSSLVRPQSIFVYDMEQRTREVLKTQDVPGYERENYESLRTYAIAADGTHVPISLVYKKGLARDGKNPLLLYGYGAYGSITDPRFSSTRLPLLDRGFIFAIAHIRGGADVGQSWYQAGKFLRKKNTFNDFIACAEYLIREKYTSSDKLVAYGGSAGGLLMGAVANMRPDLFRAIIAGVPFVDVINTMLDPSIPLTTGEFEEWGNPAEKEYYDYMLSYSPYDNVTAQEYPAMFVTAGLNDPRVHYWEPAKWVARLREVKTDNNLLILKTNMTAGHGGASGRYDNLRELSQEYAFAVYMTGLKK